MSNRNSDGYLFSKIWIIHGIVLETNFTLCVLSRLDRYKIMDYLFHDNINWSFFCNKGQSLGQLVLFLNPFVVLIQLFTLTIKNWQTFPIFLDSWSFIHFFILNIESAIKIYTYTYTCITQIIFWWKVENVDYITICREVLL